MVYNKINIFFLNRVISPFIHTSGVMSSFLNISNSIIMWCVNVIDMYYVPVVIFLFVYFIFFIKCWYSMATPTKGQPSYQTGFRWTDILKYYYQPPPTGLKDATSLIHPFYYCRRCDNIRGGLKIPLTHLSIDSSLDSNWLFVVDFFLV